MELYKTHYNSMEEAMVAASEGRVIPERLSRTKTISRKEYNQLIKKCKTEEVCLFIVIGRNYLSVNEYILAGTNI